MARACECAGHSDGRPSLVDPLRPRDGSGHQERWEQETGAGWAVTDGSRVLGRVGLKRVELDEARG